MDKQMAKLKIVAIVQGRMSSKRLPGKDPAGYGWTAHAGQGIATCTSSQAGRSSCHGHHD